MRDGGTSEVWSDGTRVSPNCNVLSNLHPAAYTILYTTAYATFQQSHVSSPDGFPNGGWWQCLGTFRDPQAQTCQSSHQCTCRHWLAANIKSKLEGESCGLSVSRELGAFMRL